MELKFPITLMLAVTVVASGCGTGSRPADPALLREGQRVFVGAGCGSCHTVASVGTHGTLGPDFDMSETLDRAQIHTQLNVGEGGMPSYRRRLTPRQERAVTEFVFQTLRSHQARKAFR